VAQDQRRHAEAEASYRHALDIKLEYGDRHSAATTYHQLGTVAQEQRRHAEAEASYRHALDIYRESDPRAASGTATRLGVTLSRLGQHLEALRILLYAAVTWHQETGNWDSNDLAWLHRERALIETGEFTALITAEVPAALAAELTAAIDQATDPEDADEADEGDNASG
jgi:tetratricopeptide (TPR) repeat protein